MSATSVPSAVTRHKLVSDWFQEYHVPLYRYLVRLVGESETAEDLLQDTFTRALSALNPDHPPNNPSAWLYRIATNLGINAIRRRRRWRWVPFVGTSHTNGFEGAVIQSQAVRSCLAQLQPREAELLLLHEYVGLTSFEIAKLNGDKPSTVRVRLARAYTRFRSLYAKESSQ